MKASLTPSRAQGFRKLLRHGELRVGMGHWTDDPVISPPAAAWLVMQGWATEHASKISLTEAGEKAGADAGFTVQNPML